MKLLQLLVFTFAVAASAHGYSFTDHVDQTTVDMTVDEENRMSGGAVTDLDKYPFVASVRIGGVTVCVATLIAPQYLVATAHCVKTNEVAMTASFDVKYDFGSDSEAVKIVKGFRHPLYNKRKHLYDVGLLKLEKPSKEKIVAMAAADGSYEKVGTMASVLGWRLTDESTRSFMLQQVDLPIISQAECSKFKVYKNQLTKGMLCAGNGDGRGSCRGDAGGPLIANGALVGFVSWAEGKCGKVPGVYTRVSYVLDYINDIVGGGDGKSFGLGSTPSGSSKTKGLEDTTAPTGESTKTTTRKPDAAKSATVDFSSISSANQHTQGLTFSFDGTIKSGADTEQQQQERNL